MKKQVLFIHGGAGKEDYAADSKLVDSLKKNLGHLYTIHFPLLPEGSEPDFGRIAQIKKEISQIKGEIILVGHSLGASMLLKYLSENEINQKIAGLFLISTPYWDGDEDWKEGLKLKKDFKRTLPTDLKIYLYHCMDDKEVPFEHLSLYSKQLAGATVRIIESGGHQLNNDLSLVAQDIRSL